MERSEKLEVIASGIFKVERAAAMDVAASTKNPYPLRLQ
jgi:hypothetical protein